MKALGRSSTLAALIVATIALLAGSGKAIVGGQLDGSRHPSVGFMIGYDEAGQAFFGCSGTLVRPTVFVTAAHCTGGDSSLVPSEVRVVFGTPLRLDSEGIPDPLVFVTGEPIPNPAFSETDGDELLDFTQISNDFGVVLLDRPANEVFPDVTLSSLPTAGFLERLGVKKNRFELVGYGLSTDAKFRELTFDGNRRFAVTDRNHAALLEPSMFGAKTNPRGSDATDGTICSGDSGGAVFFGTTLVAVISAGDFCRKVSLAARLDVPIARTFLDDFVALP